jgi:hypothetical protein
MEMDLSYLVSPVDHGEARMTWSRSDHHGEAMTCGQRLGLCPSLCFGRSPNQSPHHPGKAMTCGQRLGLCPRLCFGRIPNQSPHHPGKARMTWSLRDHHYTMDLPF